MYEGESENHAKKKIQHMWIHKYERSEIENKIKKNKAGK